VSEVSGTVRSADGAPIEGVVVMGGTSTTRKRIAKEGSALVRPDMALFFWCTGFLPVTRLVNAGEPQVDVVLRPAVMRASV